MDSVPYSLRRPSPTNVVFAHGTVWSSSMCILTGMEQSGNELLNCSMNWAVNVSVE